MTPLLISLLLSLVAAINALKLHKLSPKVANSSGAVCLDGSPPAIYFDPATDPKFNTSWVIFFRGGGWCYNEDDCADRSLTDLGSTNHLDPELTYGGPLDPDPSNPFAGFNRVLFWYCDGASFSGDVATPVSAKGHTMYFRGHRILDQLFNFLTTDFGFSRATDVLLTGCSAGGLATFMHVDYISSKLLPSSVSRYKALPLSGFFLMHDTIYGKHFYPEEMKYVFEMQNCTHNVNKNCINSSFSGEEWRCIFANETAAHVKTNIFIINSAVDKWQMQNIWLGDQACVNDGEFDNCTIDEISDLNNWQTDFLTDLTNTGLTTLKGNGIFIESCSEHCAMDGPGFSEITIDGVSMNDAVKQWWNAPVDAEPSEYTYLPCSLSDGTPHQCNPTCRIQKNAQKN